MAVPEFGYPSLVGVAGEGGGDLRLHVLQGAELVGALGDSDGPLGVGAQGKAGDAQVGGLLLQAAGVGDRQAAVEDQVHESDVVQRFQQLDRRLVGQLADQAGLLQVFSCARMDREDDRQPGREMVDHVAQRLQRNRAVHVGRAVQGEHRVVALSHAELLVDRGGLDVFAHHLQGIDHDIADAHDLLGRHSFVEQMLIPVGGGGPQEVSQHIGGQTVDLFWHAAVERTQASLQVGHQRAVEAGGGIVLG